MKRNRKTLYIQIAALVASAVFAATGNIPGMQGMLSVYQTADE